MVSSPLYISVSQQTPIEKGPAKKAFEIFVLQFSYPLIDS
jgi:hypothetical protein